ncbi:protein phosphatase 1F [Scaptodrosophila lebanonensis]|uniref:Protein phosphatase 1F n=1 Tax=Drosophila lebanonensis TaxID=7225 RepID=A0A6J2U9C3_DROLE|nr:protein phosphatase 1F [Scaptodrosophila lebanonensis]
MAEETKCLRLSKFKEFIAANKDSVAGNESMRSCVTRSSNETYRVNSEERHAEIVSCIWSNLTSKGCPPDFKLKLMHYCTQQLEQEELYSTKECEINVDDDTLKPQYDLLKLQKFVVNHLNKLLIKLTDNASADQLQNFADNELCKQLNDCKCTLLPSTCTHAVAFLKNKPRKMEDRYVCLERFGEMFKLSNKDYRFFGVFDGHSGALSACYVTNQLPYLLAQQLQMDTRAQINAEFYRNAFETVFLQANQRFTQKRITSGTTAVCALIATNHLYVAWVGDSKALLVGKRMHLQLVKPHKPEANDERRRIEAAGGTVIHAQGQWRVNGILNVARSIGDYSVEAVIAEPDFVDLELNEAHDFLVMGTDGLWDHVPEAYIIEAVYESLANETIKLEDIPKLLIEAAKERDSQDNITVILELLKPREQIVNG